MITQEPLTDSQMERMVRYVAKFGEMPGNVGLPGITEEQLADLLAAAAERDEPLTQETAEALADELGIAYRKEDAPE